MGSNQQYAFCHHVLNRIGGIQNYGTNQNSITVEGDTFVVSLKRGATINKATRIEMRPGPDETVHVTFLKGKPGAWRVISDHPETFFDGLQRLLYDHTGILTYEHNKGDESRSFRMTPWQRAQE